MSHCCARLSSHWTAAIFLWEIETLLNLFVDVEVDRRKGQWCATNNRMVTYQRWASALAAYVDKFVTTALTTGAVAGQSVVYIDAIVQVVHVSGWDTMVKLVLYIARRTFMSKSPLTHVLRTGGDAEVGGAVVAYQDSGARNKFGLWLNTLPPHIDLTRSAISVNVLVEASPIFLCAAMASGMLSYIVQDDQQKL